MKSQRKRARLESSLNKIDLKIMGDRFWCPRFDSQRPVGTCLRCKSKGCKYKKALKYYWLTYWGKDPSSPVDQKNQKKLRGFTKQNPRMQWSRKKKKWYRWYYDANGNTVVEDASDMGLPPPSLSGVDNDDGEIDTEPAHIVLRDEKE